MKKTEKAAMLSEFILEAQDQWENNLFEAANYLAVESPDARDNAERILKAFDIEADAEKIDKVLDFIKFNADAMEFGINHGYYLMPSKYRFCALPCGGEIEIGEVDLVSQILGFKVTEKIADLADCIISNGMLIYYIGAAQLCVSFEDEKQFFEAIA